MTPAGFEPAILGMKIQCPEPLDDGATNQVDNSKKAISIQ